MTSSDALAPYRILIVTAVVAEAKALVKALRLRKLPGELLAWAKEDVALVVVGVRAKRLNELLKQPRMAGARGVVLAGVAGGLASELHVGSVVIDGKGAPASVRDMAGGVRFGLIHTSATIAATPQEKGRLLAQTGCLAVDMETAIVRAFAARRGAAFLSVRAISDMANEMLDPELLGLVDEAGKVNAGGVIGMILKGKLGEMLRMRKAMGLAMRSLKEVVAGLVASNWPGKATGRPGRGDGAAGVGAG